MKCTTLLGLMLLFCLPVFAQQNAPPLEIECYPRAGFYNRPVEVELYASARAEIHYTLDGTTPSRRSPMYKQPVLIDTTTVVRAIAYRDGEASAYFASTYFINEPRTNFLVVSIGITPSTLFHPKTGMFMAGNQLENDSWKMPGANFWTRKEVTAHVEIFEPTGRTIHNSLSGFRLFGGMSRLFPQKSLTIVARDRYGEKRIEYPVFGEEGLDEFKFLVLRNSGSDWGKTHFRDAFMTSLLEDWDMEMQDYRPAHVYLNGSYWGIYNIREKVNRYFLADHTKGVDKDSLDLIEHHLIRKRGSTVHYRRMLKFLEENSLRDPKNYAYIQTKMDVDNFMDYQIAQIFFDNQDAGGNIKYWRPQTPDGRWRWIMFDTDWGFGLHEPRAYLNNSLAFHTEPDGPAWPNPPWSTFILRKLLENEEFKTKFVNRFADHLNTTFEPQRIEYRIEEMHQTLIPEIPRQLKRWRLSEQEWHEHVERLREFGRERQYYTRLHLMDMFNTGGLRTLQVVAEGGGTLLLNDHVEIGSGGFTGQYFENYPVSIEVKPEYGYRLVGWEGVAADRETSALNIKLKEDKTIIKAIFEKYEHPLAGKVMFNEISANNRRSDDWIELYNNSNEPVNLRGWILTDLKNEFVFPNVSIAPNDYLVICEDAQEFYMTFPETYNAVSGLGFGINKREERLQLFSSYGAMVDSMYYQLPPTDSIFTLSLLLPTLDNSDLENWEMRPGKGSPNAPNPYFLESRIQQMQRAWMEIGIAAGVVILCIGLLILRHRNIL